VSRSDDRSGRAWEDGTPTVRERFSLAVRQHPIRGAGILLLLLLSFAFFVATVIEFRILDWLTILGAGVLLLLVVLGGIGVATLLMRSD
jgi:uncharacterized integral membrane protein